MILLFIATYCVGFVSGMVLLSVMVVSDDRDCDDAYMQGYEAGLKDSKIPEIAEKLKR